MIRLHRLHGRATLCAERESAFGKLYNPRVGRQIEAFYEGASVRVTKYLSCLVYVCPSIEALDLETARVGSSVSNFNTMNTTFHLSQSKEQNSWLTVTPMRTHP